MRPYSWQTIAPFWIEAERGDLSSVAPEDARSYRIAAQPSPAGRRVAERLRHADSDSVGERDEETIGEPRDDVLLMDEDRHAGPPRGGKWRNAGEPTSAEPDVGAESADIPERFDKTGSYPPHVGQVAGAPVSAELAS